MSNIKITIEADENKNLIVLTENDIMLDGKRPTIDDCTRWFDIFSGIRKLFAIYAKEIVENTVNNITKL